MYYYGFIDANTFVITIHPDFYVDLYELDLGYNALEYYLRNKELAEELYKLDFVKQVYPVSKGQSLPDSRGV